MELIFYCCIISFYFQLNEIMPGHYCDVVEERSIAKLCGYPICSNRLTKVWYCHFLQINVCSVTWW